MNASITPITLDPRLSQDSVMLGHHDNCQHLLMRNALYPWIIIVPNTAETEFYCLPESQQMEVVQQINLVSRFIKQHFTVDKLNVASIGNIVSQLHIHVIGRRKSDACWPGVVWGKEPFVAYTKDEINSIKTQWDNFTPSK